MLKVKCLNCSHEFEVTKAYKDNLGLHTICPECESSFDIDNEIKEISKERQTE